jgi:S1-C subfamily serine protease
MRRIVGLVTIIAVGLFTRPVQAQDFGALFRKVSPTVVVIRARGREVSSGTGISYYSEIGSGVLISPDGKVMTAAHVVHAMDEITVQFFGGETVAARVAHPSPRPTSLSSNWTPYPLAFRSRPSVTRAACRSAIRWRSLAPRTA